jgi:transcriptional regulator GlxA family with amidase domain
MNSTAADREARAPAGREAAEATPGGGLSRRALTRACSFMEANLGEAIGLRDIAGAACVSRSHFARMFRLSTGCSVMAYLYRLRVERAKAMLIQEPLPLAELSQALGFSHHSHFTRVFRRHTGMNPRAFRHRYGNDEGAAGGAWPDHLPETGRPRTKQHAGANRGSSVQA